MWCAATEAMLLLEWFSTWNFGPSIIIWHNVVFQMNMWISWVLMLQLIWLLRFMQIVVFFRTLCYVSVLVWNCRSCGIEKRFEPQMCYKNKNKMFIWLWVQTSEECFHQEFFISLVGYGLSSVNSQFSQLFQWNEIYGFNQNLESFLNAVKAGNVKNG